MSHATAPDGVRLSWDAVGLPGREPVLLVQGLGADRLGWAFQRFGLGLGLRTVAFDNRGAGTSDKPFGRYSLLQMADDAVAVMDAAGLDSAHVVGASMGGAIAQLVAVRHPERVRSLVLTCTACRHHTWRRELLSEWAAVANERGMGELARRAMRWLVGPRSLRRFAPALGLFGPVAMRVPPHAFAAQVRAILDMDDAVRDELPRLQVPTLVVVGNQDILTPRGDSEELAELIPGAELVVVSGAAHGLMVEHATTYNRVVGDFLRRTVAARASGERPAAPVRVPA